MAQPNAENDIHKRLSMHLTPILITVIVDTVASVRKGDRRPVVCSRIIYTSYVALPTKYVDISTCLRSFLGVVLKTTTALLLIPMWLCCLLQRQLADEAPSQPVYLDMYNPFAGVQRDTVATGSLRLVQHHIESNRKSAQSVHLILSKTRRATFRRRSYTQR